MVKLTISEAARRAGVKRQVLYRKMEKGSLSKEISEDGNPVIDLSELVRIYPQAATCTGQPDRTDEQSGGQLVTGGWQKEATLLQERIASLEADKAALRRDLDHERNEASTTRDRLLALLERHVETVRLLTDQRTQASAQSKRGLWQRLTGRWKQPANRG
jgi:hypothetical protein